jgi:DNA-binding transcriptional ArsR family regulator
MTFRVDAERLARSRFVVSPLVELTNGLEVLVRPHRAPYATDWVRRTRRRVDPASVALLFGLVGHDSWYVPDFLVPLPDRYAPELTDELAAVAATPAHVVRHQLRMAFRIGPPPAAALRRSQRGRDPRSPLPAAVAEALDTGGEAALASRVAEQLARCWRPMLADSWATLRRVLDEDVRHRATTATRVGFAEVIGDLHPKVRWDGRRVMLQHPYELDVDAAPGLVLAPSVFLPRPAVWLDEPGQAMLGYPARGRGAVFATAEPAPNESAILGPRRAALLKDLGTPRSTKELAARHRLSAPTVSYHLSRLREAGLVAARRSGQSVLYERTGRAESLLTLLDVTPTA